jgi:hypothetical protein
MSYVFAKSVSAQLPRIGALRFGNLEYKASTGAQHSVQLPICTTEYIRNYQGI